MKSKIFMDTVHGFIQVSAMYCDKIIDTELFQRLRRIEQTSMRSLFPCAHHDRFIHSLGTFHIGSKIINSVLANCEYFDKLDLDKKTVVQTFELACLLHDIGHCPFSHSTENYYGLNVTISDELKKAYDNDKFTEDIECSSQPKNHEIVSAIIIKRHYEDSIRAINESIDLNLIARMVCGIKYSEIVGNNAYYNCLIDLLNGLPIDADKLDYILRDKWASGFGNYNIDTDRLLNSVRIIKRENTFKIVFHKNAISEMQSVVSSRNAQYYWVFNHHKVKYEQSLLIRAIEECLKHISGDDTNAAISNYFNFEQLSRSINYYEKLNISKITDDDIIVLFKSCCDDVPAAKEWLSRNYRLRSVWKSYSEFKVIFKDIRETYLKENGRFQKFFSKTILKVLTDNGFSDSDYHIEEVKIKSSFINKNEIYVLINSEPVCYTDLGISNCEDLKNDIFFIYLYLSDQALPLKDMMIEQLKIVCN